MDPKINWQRMHRSIDCNESPSFFFWRNNNNNNKNITAIKFELQREKTYLWTCAPCEDSDQPVCSRGLIRIFAEQFWIAKGAKFLQADTEDSDQTARMCGPIYHNWAQMSGGTLF